MSYNLTTFLPISFPQRSPERAAPIFRSCQVAPVSDITGAAFNIQHEVLRSRALVSWAVSQSALQVEIYLCKMAERACLIGVYRALFWYTEGLTMLARCYYNSDSNKRRSDISVRAF